MKKDNNISDYMLEKFKSQNHSCLKIFQVIIVFNKGLVPKTGPLPQTRKFWSRPTSSF